MTPAQRSALETLCGRSLTSGEVTAIDPKLVGARDDKGIAALLGKGPPGMVPLADFVAWTATGPRAAIEDKALLVGDPLRASALSLRDLCTSNLPGLDLSRQSTVTLLVAWVAANAISARQRDDLIALGSRAVEPYAVAAALDALLTLEWRVDFVSKSEDGANLLPRVRFVHVASGRSFDETVPGNDTTRDMLRDWADKRRRQLATRDRAGISFDGLTSGPLLVSQ